MSKQSQTITRRSVAKGAAWAVPAAIVSASAPAFASSNQECTKKTLSWTTKNSDLSATGSEGMQAVATQLGSTNISFENMTVRAVKSDLVPSGNWLYLQQTGNNSAGQSVTIKLPETAYCAHFFITDIDAEYVALNNRYIDNVTVQGFQAELALSSNTRLQVNGGNAHFKGEPPLDPTNRNGNGIEPEDKRGTVKFSSSTPIDTIKITYNNSFWNSGSEKSKNKQFIYISPITYSTTPCAC